MRAVSGPSGDLSRYKHSYDKDTGAFDLG